MMPRMAANPAGESGLGIAAISAASALALSAIALAPSTLTLALESVTPLNTSAASALRVNGTVSVRVAAT
ncbi:hypothetical protein BEL07_08325 [Mycolicibacterium grossiae]|uniref:Uncharacterized protein n=1 Tax=Mycolicibacterium grossiae TaxID=1552759 RepID=A0A1E8Q721_9MYCO|nr:hypothetical protein BEL07_08325 [Mycolicibacterium grossiae]